MKLIPLLGPAFSTQTPESFFAYVKSLIVLKDSKASKTVQNISLTFKPNKTVIRLKRESKIITRDELKLLSDEYSKTELELLQIFTKRKIGISYDDTDERKLSDSAELLAAKERNAKPRKASKRKKASADKLLEPGCDPCLPEESSVLIAQGT